ncbi:MAG: HD-GYP domain-containing protein [Firmicutes bacterium]|nr:HD-GYP domain-containing protein [Alicyclobacillaceae bacterium]MCL6497715.1 HD-GYP domain-containing protein [Bacillota bacterium]
MHIDRQLYPKPLVGYMVVIDVLAAVVLWRFHPDWSVTFPTLAVFYVAVMVSSLYPVVSLRGNMAVAVSLPVIFSAGIILGPGAGAWLGCVGSPTIRELTGKVKWPSVVFNRAQYTLLGWVSGELFHLLGGSPAHLSLAAVSLPLAVSAGAVFFLNMGLVVVALALRQRRSVFEMWRVHMSWGTVNYLVMLPMGYIMATIYRWAGAWPELIFLVPLAQSRWIFSLLVEARRAYRRGVQVLLAALDAKDPYTYSHSVRVGRYAELLARYMGLPEDRVEAVGDAGRLHDVGKLATPDRILLKADRLGGAERRVMRLHPVAGETLLAQVGLLGCARDWVLHHHERWDGTGYPARQMGCEVALETRIIMVVDAYDAMTSDRPYRSAMTHEQALAELQRVAGTQLDPEVVRHFIALTETVDLEAWARPGKGWQHTPLISGEASG